MVIFIEWILIGVSTLIFYNSLNKLMSYKSKSIVDYIILIIYIFNCLPIFFDKIIGPPQYNEWFFNFEVAMSTESVNVIYSLYILFAISSLAIYGKYQSFKEQEKIYHKNSSLLFNNNVLPFIILLPYIHVLLSGQLSSYFMYGTYNARGISSSFYQLNIILIFISIFAFCCYFFSKNLQKKDLLLLIIYGLSIAWLDGKRYIIVTLGIMFLFYYLNSLNANLLRIKLKRSVFILILVFISFNILYITSVKTIADSSLESVYTSFRIDLGRDDVTKFVIYKEVIEKDSILEYRGQSFLATLLVLVPRDIWLDKPLPHYRYLTSELYETASPLNIHSGITPSFFEMSIANLGIKIGIPFAILFLLIITWLIDKVKSVSRKSLYLLLVIGLLTQSIDALIAYIVIAPLSAYGFWLKKLISSRKGSLNHGNKRIV